MQIHNDEPYLVHKLNNINNIYTDKVISERVRKSPTTPYKDIFMYYRNCLSDFIQEFDPIHIVIRSYKWKKQKSQTKINSI